MKQVPLGDITVKARTTDPAKLLASEFVYIDLSSVDQGTKAISDVKVLRSIDAPSRARQVVAPNDVLVATVRPNLNGVAQVGPELDGAIASTGFTVLRSVPSLVDANYLFQWVKSAEFISDMITKSTGASYPAVSDRIIRESMIPLPPLDEQRRIAAILDKADELQTKRREALAHLDVLTQSIFHSMFGDLRTDVPWPRVAISEICSTIVDCVNRTAPLADGPTEFKMIRTSNVRSRAIHLNNVRYVDEETFKRWNRRTTPQMGDVVLTREAPMGEAGVIRTSDHVFLGQRTMLYRPNTSKLEATYLLYFLTSDFMQSEYLRNGSGSTVKHLSVPYCRTFDVYLPPLELQQAFATRVAAVERLKEMHRRHLTELDALFASLQHRAFRGEL